MSENVINESAGTDNPALNPKQRIKHLQGLIASTKYILDLWERELHDLENQFPKKPKGKRGLTDRQLGVQRFLIKLNERDRKHT